MSEIAAFFGPDSLPQEWVEPLSLVPQVYHDGGPLDEKQEWVSVSGTHTASGVEQYVFIGSQNDYENTTITPARGSSGLGNIYETAYYYVDDITICLQEDGECLCLSTSSADTTGTGVDAPVQTENDHSLPNLFTPNNDNVNDLWEAGTLAPSDNIIIFNRWGQEIIRLNHSNPSWDGTKDGRPLSDGVYFYYANIRGEVSHGSIHLYR